MSFFREKHPKKRLVARHKAFAAARCFELLIRVFFAEISAHRRKYSGLRFGA